MSLATEVRLGVGGCLHCGGFVEDGRWQYEPTCINCAKVYYTPSGAPVITHAGEVAQAMQQRPIRQPEPPPRRVVEQPVLPRVTAMLMEYAKGPMTKALQGDDRLHPERPQFDEDVFMAFCDDHNTMVDSIINRCMEKWPHETCEALVPKQLRNRENLSDIMWDTANEMAWNQAE